MALLPGFEKYFTGNGIRSKTFIYKKTEAMRIQGEGFILRPFELTDASAMARHANNRKIADNLRDAFPFPYNENDAKAFIDIVLKDNNPVKNFIIEIDGEAAGTTGFRPGEDVYRINAEIGYWLGEAH